MMDIETKAYDILHTLCGKDAQFREGQLEAIKATLTNKRTLIVQKTGWGKSLIYFTCTKILREQGSGITFVISPLLVLMENQLKSVEKLGLKCDVLNSQTRDRRNEILDKIINNELDLVLITPETLFSDDVQKALPNIKIGLFVVDEAHCISDWGHDFRLEYGNLIKVISKLPQYVPLLATTATANNRVVDDLEKQLGGNVHISRGSLTRQTLAIEVLNMPNRESRYAWILKNIKKLPGTGIIYCLTQRDCDYVSNFLNKNGIKALPYYSSSKKEKELNETIEKFQNNKIKAIVATTKLGMGYDKGDISFVIHFQCPQNIVNYYQQIGRAGRNIDLAYAILMFGKEDQEINNYFINTAFPKKEDCEKVLKVISESNGLKLYNIEHRVNIKRSEVDKVVNFLQNENAIYLDKKDNKYYATLHEYTYNEVHYNEIKELRKKEQAQMQQLLKTTQCYSKYIVNCLDDYTATDCGKCANCLSHSLLDNELTQQDLDKALSYLDKLIMTIEPRKMWPETRFTERKKIEFINQEGICLCKYGDAGYGELVKKGKYEDNLFCDELVGKSTSLLKPYVIENKIEAVTCVPSLRNDKVKDFAERLAKSLSIPFIDTLTKTDSYPQKFMQNSSFQCENAYQSFHVKENILIPKKMILVDDMVDSKWTMTVCGYKLMELGAEFILPFALADSSQKED